MRRELVVPLIGAGTQAFAHAIDVLPGAVLAELALADQRLDPQRDTEFVMGPIDVLDHAARVMGYGSKMGIDATRKLPEEGFNREWPPVIEMTPEVQAKADALLEQLGLMSGIDKS